MSRSNLAGAPDGLPGALPPPSAAITWVSTGNVPSAKVAAATGAQRSGAIGHL